MATKGYIAIMVEGGLIQEIRASKDIAKFLTVEVYDLDRSDFETEEEYDNFKETQGGYDEISQREDMEIIY
jgi:hypothetical protein